MIQHKRVLDRRSVDRLSWRQEVKFTCFPFPLRLVAEQHRMVAKIDLLTALRARLEANLATGDATRRRLLDALLNEALKPIKGVAA